MMNSEQKPVTVDDGWTAGDVARDFVALLIAIAAAVGLYSTFGNAASATRERQMRETQLADTGLGDELVFPDGWMPVECESESKRDSNMNDCTWVCQPINGRPIYRYCTPTIQVSDSEEVK